MNYISEWILDSPKIQGLVSGGTFGGGTTLLIGGIEMGGAIFGVIAGGILSYWLIKNARQAHKRGKLEIELTELKIADRIELTELRREKETRHIDAEESGHYRRKDDQEVS